MEQHNSAELQPIRPITVTSIPRSDLKLSRQSISGYPGSTSRPSQLRLLKTQWHPSCHRCCCGQCRGRSSAYHMPRAGQSRRLLRGEVARLQWYVMLDRGSRAHASGFAGCFESIGGQPVTLGVLLCYRVPPARESRLV